MGLLYGFKAESIRYDLIIVVKPWLENMMTTINGGNYCGSN
jgi:hypothetical protein